MVLHRCVAAVIAVSMVEYATWYFDFVNFNATGFSTAVRDPGRGPPGLRAGESRESDPRADRVHGLHGVDPADPRRVDEGRRRDVRGVLFASAALDVEANLGRVDDAANGGVFWSSPSRSWSAVYVLWVFTALSRTLAQLEARRQTAKLDLYRKFTNALAVSVVASVAWMAYETWFRVTERGGEVGGGWVTNAFWHCLGFALTAAVCFLWRPSQDGTRFAYAELSKDERAEEDDGGESGGRRRGRGRGEARIAAAGWRWAPCRKGRACSSGRRGRASRSDRRPSGRTRSRWTMTTATSRRSSSEGTRETQRMKENGRTYRYFSACSCRRSVVRTNPSSSAPARGSKRLRAAVPRARAGMRTTGSGGWGAVSERAPARRRDRVPRARGALARARRFPAPPPPLPRRRLASPDADPASIRPPPRPRAAPDFYFLQAPAMEDGVVRLALEVAYACVCGVVTAAFYKAASTDPADDTRACRCATNNARARSDRRALADRVPPSPRLARSSPPPSPLPRPLPPRRRPPASRGRLFCNLCAYNVARGSKHCRACDKCVLHFDHHCKWLNNCVGSKNYHSFFLLVSTVLFQVLAQMAAGAYLLRWALVDKADASASLADVDRFPLRASVNHQEFVVFLVAYLFAGVCLGVPRRGPVRVPPRADAPGNHHLRLHHVAEGEEGGGGVVVPGRRRRRRVGGGGRIRRPIVLGRDGGEGRRGVRGVSRRRQPQGQPR